MKILTFHNGITTPKAINLQKDAEKLSADCLVLKEHIEAGRIKRALEVVEAMKRTTFRLYMTTDETA